MEALACPCKRTSCERHGDCERCREYHHSKSSGKALTRCEKLKKRNSVELIEP